MFDVNICSVSVWALAIEHSELTLAVVYTNVGKQICSINDIKFSLSLHTTFCYSVRLLA